MRTRMAAVAATIALGCTLGRARGDVPAPRPTATTAQSAAVPTATAPSAAASTATAPTIALTVRAHGFRDATGQAVIALYRSSNTWLKIDRAFRRTTAPIKDGAVEVRFDALPRGEYAVAVVHDATGNGRLDMRWFPWPKPREGAGVSNDATGGPPRWRDAKLELSADAAVDVKLIY